MVKSKSEMHLPSLDDIFTTQEERDSANLEKVENIKLSDIDDFPNHPFKITDNYEFRELMASIKEKGVLAPVIVRPKPNGRYEMISGHRRKKASELLDVDFIPCIVRNLTDIEATIIMVDSNLQREKILPSEKAFAYRLKLEALEQQGKRTDLTSSQFETKLDSAKIIAQENNESRSTVFRYIRFTELIPELLQFVDNDVLGNNPKIGLSPAKEISYLTKEEQKRLLDLIKYYDCTPSHAQTIRMKNLSEKGELTNAMMEKIMSEEKPNQTPMLKVSMNRLKNVLPKELRNEKERENYVIEAVSYYTQEKRKSQHERVQKKRVQDRER